MRVTNALLASPGKAAGAFTFAAAAAVFATLLAHQLNYNSLPVLVGAIVVTGVQSSLRLFFGHRLAHWTLHVGILVDIALITVVCVLEPKVDVEFSFLYLWVLLFVALYFPARVFLAYYVSVAGSYAVVALAVKSPRQVVEMWLPLLGTGAILGLITTSLITALRQSSDVDPLTSLSNRRAWDRRAEEELERAKRAVMPLSLVIFDIDDFKEVNDRHGHQAGDELLRTLANGWRKTVRGSGDFIARLGGDEFGYLAPGVEQSTIGVVIDRLRVTIPVGITCSFGAATWDGASTFAELFRVADEEMYRMKRERKLEGPTGGGAKR